MFLTNTSLFLAIFELQHKYPLLDSLMIFGAEYLIYVTFVFAIILAFKFGAEEKKALFLTIISLGISILLIWLIRLFYIEQRPFATYNFDPLIQKMKDPSFPSGHTTTMAVVAFSFYYYKSKFAPIFVLLLVWVGFARVFVGVHFPLDILGGVITGLASVHIAWHFKNWLRRYI